MRTRDIGRPVRLPDEIEQDFGCRFLQTQPPGNPLEFLGIIRRYIPAIGFVARAREVSSRAAAPLPAEPVDYCPAHDSQCVINIVRARSLRVSRPTPVIC